MEFHHDARGFGSFVSPNSDETALLPWSTEGKHLSFGSAPAQQPRSTCPPMSPPKPGQAPLRAFGRTKHGMDFTYVDSLGEAKPFGSTPGRFGMQHKYIRTHQRSWVYYAPPMSGIQESPIRRQGCEPFDSYYFVPQPLAPGDYLRAREPSMAHYIPRGGSCTRPPISPLTPGQIPAFGDTATTYGMNLHYATNRGKSKSFGSTGRRFGMEHTYRHPQPPARQPSLEHYAAHELVYGGPFDCPAWQPSLEHYAAHELVYGGPFDCPAWQPSLEHYAAHQLVHGGPFDCAPWQPSLELYAAHQLRHGGPFDCPAWQPSLEHYAPHHLVQAL
jgi:hypothetical protein